MMSKKHYKAIAEIVKSAKDEGGKSPSPAFDNGSYHACRTIANNLAVQFKQDNPRFDKNKFLEACGF